MSQHFFSAEELSKFKNYEGLALSDVYYHVWKNNANPEQSFESLDYVELIFENKYQLMLTAGEETDGIKIVELDIEKEKERLHDQFKGQIEIVSFDVTHDFPWSEAQTSELLTIMLKDSTGAFLNDELLLNFGENSIQVSLSPVEGLVVEIYEDI